MNDTLRTISDLTPLGAGVQALQDATGGSCPSLLHLTVLAGWTVAAGRWPPATSADRDSRSPNGPPVSAGGPFVAGRAGSTSWDTWRGGPTSTLPLVVIRLEQPVGSRSQDTTASSPERIGRSRRSLTNDAAHRFGVETPATPDPQRTVR
ncbi:hypothetical protein Aab01nite_46170 [Paractinoplanes abujensis]|uniref:Uncharacterized protein n=1 Tax=Paractinoplanes abujensis TaxID=882441 RepID=A0A7W7FZ44_9ACTN|nr:hypothetical protein [Actinoplanes abujensis]MBB4690264.1 hypothetical protein [Actinoplanes abujensis]GID21027.1 hypothetical protein Aab01nite_46170 [Actinoplanes abujensis]